MLSVRCFLVLFPTGMGRVRRTTNVHPGQQGGSLVRGETHSGYRKGLVEKHGQPYMATTFILV